MKDNLPYGVFPTFVVRTPLFPFNFLLSLISDKITSSEYLKFIIQQPVVAEALFIASPEFHEQLQNWINEEEIDTKKQERFSQSIYKYLSRMASRCTPFGLFSGCCVGLLGDNTEVLLGKISEHNRHTRLDMFYLCNLAQALSKNIKIKTKLKYYPNTSIYESGGKLRYIEYRYISDHRTHHLIEIKHSDFLNLVLKNAKKGKKIQELVNLLIGKGVSKSQSNEYIYKLIDNQILISELNPTVTAEEFLIRILKILAPIDQIEKIKKILNQTKVELNKIDLAIGNSTDQYYKIAKNLNKIGIDYKLKFLFQTDLKFNSIISSVNYLTLNSIKEGIYLLNILTPKYTNKRISNFKEAFTKRYDTRECALLQVLDTETGIGYLQTNRNSEGDFSPLISDIVFPSKENSSFKIEWNNTQDFLFSKFLEATEKNLFEIELIDEEIKSFNVSMDDLPDIFSCLVKIEEASSKKYPGGRLVMDSVGGSNAPQLLGRFCHSDSKIFEFVKEIVEFEHTTCGEDIIAEIVHLPSSRIGNVILRPILHNYEIPILTSPSVDSEHTIALDDLFISVHNNEIILRSNRLNKRIIPRMCNAHNFSNNALPVYQFLCDLQSQNIRPSIGFNWGSIVDNCAFRPRVVYKNLIISPATWVVKNEDISALYKIQNDNQLIADVKDWREKNRMPTMVLFEQGDNNLFVTFENLLSIKTLLTIVKHLNRFTLKEFLFNPDNAVVKSVEGVFTNEFLFTFYRNCEKKR